MKSDSVCEVLGRVTASDRARALHILHDLQADLTAEQTLRPGVRWLTSVMHARAFNEALLLLADDLSDRYVHARLCGDRTRIAKAQKTGRNLAHGPVYRDHLLSKVQDVLQRIQREHT
jgi:hypothetical protein